MAHFAEIDSNNIVLRILVVSEAEEHRGEEYLSVDLGLGGRWIQTSYNNNMRKSYASIGGVYNEELDIFLPQKPFPSWVLNSTKGEWEAPIARPSTPNTVFGWDETNMCWIASDPIVM